MAGLAHVLSCLGALHACQGGPVRLAGPKKENKWRQLGTCHLSVLIPMEDGTASTCQPQPRYLSKFGYDIGNLHGLCVLRAHFRNGLERFLFSKDGVRDGKTHCLTSSVMGTQALGVSTSVSSCQRQKVSQNLR